MEPEAFLSKADLIVTDGKVATLDAAGTIAEAIAIKGERILAVGRTEAITEFACSQTQQINAAGRLVVPGLIEPCDHGSGGIEGGIALSRGLPIDQRDLRAYSTSHGRNASGRMDCDDAGR